jgi:hypothetical protein
MPWFGYCFFLSILLVYGLFSKTYFAWRLALIFVAAGFLLWALLVINNGFNWDEFLTNGFLAVILFLMATIVDDPRAIRRLKRAVSNLDINEELIIDAERLD